MTIDSPTLSLALIVFSLTIYIIRNGRELGLGMLYPTIKSKSDLIELLSSPWWRNETWILIALAGWALVFPLVYQVVFKCFLAPLFVLIISQALRYYSVTQLKQNDSSPWGWVFFATSLTITFTHGIMLGVALDGFESTFSTARQNSIAWLTPLSGFCAIGLVVAYSLLGITWLIKNKTTQVPLYLYERTTYLAMSLLLAIMIVSLWIPLMETHISQRWFSWPQVLYLSPIPLLTAWVGFLLWLAILEQRRKGPYALAVCLFVLSMTGLCISTWPYIIPWEYTIWQATGPEWLQYVGLAFLISAVPLSALIESTPRQWFHIRKEKSS